MRLTGAPSSSGADLGPDLFEMANLTSKDTGVEGVIYISTAQGAHAPRVTWYPGRPHRQAACLSMTIEPEPQAFNHDLPARVAAGATEKVARWVRLNHAALIDFWRDGETWTRDEVNAFIDGLEKLA
jgi:hypothetical protein